MPTAQKKVMTAAEYLEFERESPVKHEFFGGELFAMAGGSETHSALAANAIGALRARLQGKTCRIYTSDMRLKIEATDYYAYPDVQVACGERKFADDKRDTLLNPGIIVEVLSPSTAAWDRGGKFWHYRHVASLQHYVLVSQEGWMVETYTRQANGAWLLDTAEGAHGVLRLAAIQAEVPIKEIYGDTDLPPDARPSSLPQPKPEKT